MAIAAIIAIISGPMQERGWRKTAELELRLANMFESGPPALRDMDTARLLRERAAERVWSSYARPGVIASTVKRMLDILFNVSALVFFLSTVGIMVSAWTRIWPIQSAIAFTLSGITTAATCLCHAAFIHWSSKKSKAEYRRKEDVARREHHNEVGDELNESTHYSRHPSDNPATPNESASHAG